MRPYWLILILFTLLLSGCKPVLKQEPETNPVQQDVNEVNLKSLDSSTPEPLAETTQDAQEIANLIIGHPDLSAGEITVQVSFNDGEFATGILGHTYPESVANKIWIAAYQNNAWALVYYGDPLVECSILAEFDVPAELVQVCKGENGELVNR